jgi:hypothetical protein
MRMSVKTDQAKAQAKMAAPPPPNTLVCRVQPPRLHPDGMWLGYRQDGKTRILLRKGLAPTTVQEGVQRKNGEAISTCRSKARRCRGTRKFQV